MKTFRFHTHAQMKPYNSDKWWISNDIVSDMHIEADNVLSALNIWREKVEEQYIEISNSAMKNKSAMYQDDKNGHSVQVGYVITAKTDFDKGDYTGYVPQYIELWVKITEERNAFDAA